MKVTFRAYDVPDKILEYLNELPHSSRIFGKKEYVEFDLVIKQFRDYRDVEIVLEEAGVKFKAWRNPEWLAVVSINSDFGAQEIIYE